MPELLELEQEDLRDLDHIADPFLRMASSLNPETEPAEFLASFRKDFARLAEESVALALGLAARLQPRWEVYKRAGWAGQARQVHALRDSLLRSFEARLRYLAQAIRIASVAAVQTGREIPGSDRLPGAIQDLNALKTQIFSNWNTLEDLEQMLVETYPFTAEQFNVLAQHHRPPQEWYEQQEQPL
jgi:hypothetical protein